MPLSTDGRAQALTLGVAPLDPSSLALQLLQPLQPPALIVPCRIGAAYSTCAAGQHARWTEHPAERLEAAEVNGSSPVRAARSAQGNWISYSNFGDPGNLIS